MYNIKTYSDSLDLEEFYSMATDRGFYNNNSKQVLVDTFAHCDRYQTWILYYNDRAVGSVSAHSLEELGILGDAYRIAARTCILADLTDQKKHMQSTNTIFKQHQHLTGQILLPLCAEWAGRDKNLYISTNNNDQGKQKSVHRIYCPTLQSIGVLECPIELEYRLSMQSFWKFNADTFYKQLSKNWWSDAKTAVEYCLGEKINL